MMEDVVLSVLTETGGRGVDVVGEFSETKMQSKARLSI